MKGRCSPSCRPTREVCVLSCDGVNALRDVLHVARGDPCHRDATVEGEVDVRIFANLEDLATRYHTAIYERNKKISRQTIKLFLEL